MSIGFLGMAMGVQVLVYRCRCIGVWLWVWLERCFPITCSPSSPQSSVTHTNTKCLIFLIQDYFHRYENTGLTEEETKSIPVSTSHIATLD